MKGVWGAITQVLVHVHVLGYVACFGSYVTEVPQTDFSGGVLTVSYQGALKPGALCRQLCVSIFDCKYQ